MKKYCEMAKRKKNVYLDTSAVWAYYDLGRAVEWAGADKITFASDGFMFNPLVEKAKVEALRIPTPYRTPKLTDEEYGMIMGGNMTRLLGF